MLTTELTSTQAEAAAAGAIIGGTLAGIGIFALAFYILMVVALWKIFVKAGEAGWKSLIPIYNVYVFCKIIRVNFWIYVLLIPVILGVISALLFKDNQNAQTTLSGLYSLGLDIYLSIMLARAFKKGVGFTIGLILLPNIFQLILAFGSSKYALKKS